MTVPVANAYDLTLNIDGASPIGVMYAREPGKAYHLRIDSDPGRETTENPVYALNLIRGMGFSERFEPGTYGWGVNIDTTTPGVVLPGGKITELEIQTPSMLFPIRSSAQLGNNIFFFGNRYPVAVSAGTAAVGTFTADFGSDQITCLTNSATVFNGRLCVGTFGNTTQTAGSMWSTTNGVAWTESPTVTRIRLAQAYWESGGTGAQRLIGMDTQTSFKTCSGDPTVAGNWTGAVSLGGSGDEVTSIAYSPRHVWFCSPTGVKDADSIGRTPNLTPFFKDAYVASNGGSSIYFDGQVHVSHGNGVVAVPVDGRLNDAPEYYHPGRRSADGSPIWGYAAPPSVWNGRIIWPIYNAITNMSHIMFAERTPEFGWVWHGSFASFSGVITHTRVASPSSGHTRLWVCTEEPGVGNRIFWVSLPFSGNAYQDMVHGGQHRFSQTASIYFPDGWDAPTSRRVQYRQDIYADNLDGVNQVGVYAQRDKGSWELQGNATSSPRTSFIPANIESPAYRIDYRADLQGSEITPPVLRAVAPHADVNREQLPVHRIRVRLARYQETHTPGMDVQDPDVTMNLIWALQSEQSSPIRVSNRKGDEMVCQVLPGIVVSDIADNRDADHERLVEMSLRELWTEWRWDSGVPWDSGRFWS